jgi:hypothetical protein
MQSHQSRKVIKPIPVQQSNLTTEIPISARNNAAKGLKNTFNDFNKSIDAQIPKIISGFVSN